MTLPVRPMQLRSERIWLLLGAAFIAGFTLAPFDLSLSSHELSSRLADVWGLGDLRDPLKSLAHLISFLMLGILVAIVYRQDPRPTSFSRLLIAGLIGCIVLEGAQFFQFGRHARAIDIGLNIVGFGVGLWIAEYSRTVRRWRLRLQAFGKRRPYFEMFVLAGTAVLWWYLGLQPAMGSLKMDWDKTFPLVFGNEVGGARPWLGELRYAAIYNRALVSGEIMQLSKTVGSANPSRTRLGEGLLIGYDFRQASAGRILAQGSISSPELALNVPARAEASREGLRLLQPTISKTSVAAGKLTNNIVSAGAFSVELWIKPDYLVQAGPARIISLSTSVGSRNFTLGQSGTGLVFRVRNRVNGVNGATHELEAPDVIETAVGHYVAVYDYGLSTVYKNGLRRDSIDLREPIYYSHLATGLFGRAGFFALAIIGLALPAMILFNRVSRPAPAHAMALGFTLLICSGPYLISCLVVGGPWRLNFFVWLAATLLVIYPAGVFYATRKVDS